MSTAAPRLAAAHEAGIVHRDLMPENVMVTRSGRAKAPTWSPDGEWIAYADWTDRRLLRRA